MLSLMSSFIVLSLAGPAHASAPSDGVLPAPKLHVVIDPGHGGVDKGAARGAIRESHIALSVAKKLADRLRDDGRFAVTLTREADVALTLPERAAIAKRVQADLFVSIHANASEDPRAHGVEFWFQNQLPADEESLFLASRENQSHEGDVRRGRGAAVTAKSDVARIIEDLRRNHRIASSGDLSRTLLAEWHSKARRRNKHAIRQGPLFVVSEVHVPSVLVELGFVSHESEGPRLTDPGHQSLMAGNLYEGIAKFAAAVAADRSR